MSRLIDADTLKSNINTAFWSGIEKIIDSAPTIDAVEVVRCKDCKEFEAIGYCLFWGDDMDADDYCSHGVRKELADVPLP